MELMPPKSRAGSRRKLTIRLICLFFLVGTLFVALLNHYLLRSYAFDFTAYNFAFFDYAHLKISPCPFYLFEYNVTFLQDHFSLTLIFLSPLYWIFGALTGTYTLLIVQSCIVVMGAWMSYKLILFKTSNFWLATLCFVYYFILLGRLTAAVADCNLAIIGSAMVPAFLYYFEKQKIIPSLVFFVLLICNREDFSLWLIFISGFLLLLHRKDKFQLKFSAALLICAILSFVIIFTWIIPALEDENKKYTLFTFAALGKTPHEALLFLFSHPQSAIELLFINHSGSNYYDGIKTEFYLVFLISGGVLLLIRPLYFVPFLPLIAKKMYNDEPIRWSIESYYSVEIVSILPVLIFFIIADFKSERIRIAVATALCLCTLAITLNKLKRAPEDHIAMLGDPQKFNFFSSSFYRPEYDLDEVYGAMDHIPDTAIVSASGKVSSHLAFRKRIYYFPRVDDAEYIFLLKKNDNWPISQAKADTIVTGLITNEGWKKISEKKDFILLHKK